MKILLIGHGDIARGMYSTLSEFFGITNISYASVSLDKGAEGFIQDLESYLQEWTDEQIVICSDLKAGSANQIAYRYLHRPQTYLISGMNLSLLLQLSMHNEINPEILKQFIAASREDITFMNELNIVSFEDDE